MIQFTKPTKGKIILLMIILVLSFIPHTFSNMFWCHATIIGFPFPFYHSGMSGVECPNPTPSYSIVGLIINLIIWYLISCVIILVYNKFKK
ncbi:MAG: hypothetical protein AABX29_08690 [Nanoarchaeota archaeon]